MMIGKRVRLRAIHRGDLKRFVRWLNDPDVKRGLANVHPVRCEDEETWFDGLAQRPEAERALSIDVHNGDDWQHVGFCHFNDLDWRVRKTEVGIVIGEKPYWNQGFGEEAMRLMLWHAFDNLNLNRVYLHVFEHNEQAISLYRKLGFSEEGRLRQDHFFQGTYVDTLVMGMLNEEFQRSVE